MFTFLEVWRLLDQGLTFTVFCFFQNKLKDETKTQLSLPCLLSSREKIPMRKTETESAETIKNNTVPRQKANSLCQKDFCPDD